MDAIATTKTRPSPRTALRPRVEPEVRLAARRAGFQQIGQATFPAACRCGSTARVTYEREAGNERRHARTSCAACGRTSVADLLPLTRLQTIRQEIGFLLDSLATPFR